MEFPTEAIAEDTTCFRDKPPEVLLGDQVDVEDSPKLSQKVNTTKEISENSIDEAKKVLSSEGQKQLDAKEEVSSTIAQPKTTLDIRKALDSFFTDN